MYIQQKTEEYIRSEILSGEEVELCVGFLIQPHWYWG